jgi:hypothetical protein
MLVDSGEMDSENGTRWLHPMVMMGKKVININSGLKYHRGIVGYP